jgi:hypothetical protein
MDDKYLLDIVLYSNIKNKNININNEFRRIKYISDVYLESKYESSNIIVNKDEDEYIPSDTVIYKKVKKNKEQPANNKAIVKNWSEYKSVCECDEKKICMPYNIANCKNFIKFIEINPIYNLIYKKEKYVINYKCEKIQEYNDEKKKAIQVNVRRHLDLIDKSTYEHKIILIISVFYYLLKHYNFLEAHKTFYDKTLDKLEEINKDKDKFKWILNSYEFDEDILDNFIDLFKNPIFL